MNEEYDKSGNRPHLFHKNNASMDSLEPLKEFFEELELSRNHLEHAQQIARIGSWEYNIPKDALTFSAYARDIFNSSQLNSKSQLKDVLAYIHSEDYDKTTKKLTEAVTKGIGFTSDFRIFHDKTGDVRYIKAQAETIWKDNKPYKLVGVVKDQTAQHYLEEEIDESRKRTRLILDHLSIGIWMKDYTTGKVEYVSKGVGELLRYPLHELYESESIWENLILPAEKTEVLSKQKVLADGETLEHQYRIQCGDGTLKWVYDQTIPWFNEEGKLTHLFGMIADISHEVEMRKKLEYLATHDALTSLPNQRSLYEKLDKLCESEHAKDFAIIYFDLDRLDMINNSLGYTLGDKIMQRCVNRLVSVLPEDAYLARLSSNDFVAVIENPHSNESLSNLAEQIIKKVNKPISVNGYELQVTTSLGISLYPKDGNEKLTLLRNAFAALKRAKQLGNNTFQFYSTSKDITSYKQFILEKDLREATENQDFEIYFQPQVETGTGVITSAEALIRWYHADWGLISPGEFIPLAEENHLIHTIGNWMIANICRQLRSWKDKGYTLRPIAVNVSPIQFMRKGLVDFIAEQLNQYDIPGKYLALEITEGTLLKSGKMVLNTLQKLREIGVNIAIDDFGTGFSSLMSLKEFEPDIIKIDQAFIQSLTGEDNIDAGITASIIHLGKALNMQVVAEGVEEHAQLAFLKQNECDTIQGYLFTKPVPLETFNEMLETGYLKPVKAKVHTPPKEERRKYFRFDFPNPLLGEMTIVELNEQKVNLGSAQILINDIGLGGLKILTSLKLPIQSNINLNFRFILMGESFNLRGQLVWKNESRGNIFYYGAKFTISEQEKERLALIINKMTAFSNLNERIPDTTFIQGSAHGYLKKHNL